MILNGTDVSTYGVIVGDRSPSRSASRTVHEMVDIPGSFKNLYFGSKTPSPLTIRVTGHIVGDTLSDLRGNIDEFKHNLQPQKQCTIRWSDMTGDSPVREWLGYRDSLDIDDIVPGWLTTGVKFTATVICPEPFALEASLQNVQTSGSLPLNLTPTVGTAPMPLVITLTASSTITDPVFSYRDKDNLTIYQITYSGTISAAQSLVIDTDAFTAEKASVNVGGYMSGTYFSVDPADGDFLGSPAGPDVYLTGSGSATLYKLEYKRRYW